MYSLNLYFIVFIIIDLVSMIRIAKDNTSTIPNLQNPSLGQIEQNSTKALMIRKLITTGMIFKGRNDCSSQPT